MEVISVKEFCMYSTVKIANPKIIFNSIAVLIVAVGFAGCKQKPQTAGPQPKLDSLSVINYFKSDPQLKGDLVWAKQFYYEHGYELGWFKDHKPLAQVNKLLTVIKKAGEEGLNPETYKVRDFDKLFKELEAAKKDTAERNKLEKEIDLSLSGTYFKWASDYYRGIVIPKENRDVEWDVKRNKIKLHKALLSVLGTRDSKYPYAEFKPLHPEYERLRLALAKYREIAAAGGWPKLPETGLKPNDNSASVAALRKRLAVEGQANVYNDTLVAAVKNFQEQNGLKPTGKVSAETAKLLNIPVQQRIKQIIINMERWRWIPKDFGQDFFMVNIPEYTLRVYEKGKQAMKMKVIVGKTMNSTPIFSDMLEYVVLAPYWNVPFNIVKEEYAEKFSNDPSLVEQLNMEVIDNNENPVDPASIDWTSLDESSFKYILRKKPGPKNDLGNVKFIFPNKNNVYLHDTPHDELFTQEKRGFSHGCVRVEKPVELAEYLLRKIPGWNRSQIMSTIALNEEKFVALKQKIPVYLVYFTAWADDAGNVHFREDIYGHDQGLINKYFAKL